MRAGDWSDTYRCGLVGWYLRRDGSLAVAEDGEMYVLSAPRSLRAAFSGVTLEPDEPRTQAGIGARDGESVALDALLELRLAAGDDWPRPLAAYGARHSSSATPVATSHSDHAT